MQRQYQCYQNINSVYSTAFRAVQGEVVCVCVCVCGVCCAHHAHSTHLRKCPFGCDGNVTAVVVGQSQRLYSGVRMFTWFDLISILVNISGWGEGADLYSESLTCTRMQEGDVQVGGDKTIEKCLIAVYSST